MTIFLDTSSLFKLYHNEPGTEETEQIFSENTVRAVFISSISKVEFSSAVWKKVRTGDINKEQAKLLITAFETDADKYTCIEVTDSILENASKLIAKYGKKGLRTLDGIQLATAVFIKNKCDLHISSDDLLKALFKTEGLKTV